MKAYTSKHDLNPEQTALVRSELSDFISELMLGRRPPTMFSDRLTDGGSLTKVPLPGTSQPAA